MRSPIVCDAVWCGVVRCKQKNDKPSVGETSTMYVYIDTHNEVKTVPSHVEPATRKRERRYLSISSPTAKSPVPKTVCADRSKAAAEISFMVNMLCFFY